MYHTGIDIAIATYNYTMMIQRCIRNCRAIGAIAIMIIRTQMHVAMNKNDIINDSVISILYMVVNKPCMHV